jgi:hypothetical protein
VIIQRLARFLRQHDWFAVVVEILVVIVGLMLAFQLDRWWEQRGEQAQEAEYIARLIADIETDVPSIEYAIELAVLRRGMADLLMQVVDDPDVALDRPVEFIASVRQAAFTYSPNLASHTFEDMQSTGNLRLLRNLEIRDALYDYYNFAINQNQFRPLQFMAEARHFELAAGVLDYAQALLEQDEWYVVTPTEFAQFPDMEVEIDAVAPAVERFRSRRELIAWIPEIRHLQVEQIFVNQELLRKADEVLESLRAYAETLNRSM